MDAHYPPQDRLFVPVLFKAHLYCGLWSDDMLFGENRDVLLEDVEIIGDKEVPVPEIVLEGADAEHRTYNVKIKNLRMNGRKLSKEEVNVKLGEFAVFPEIS